MRSKILALFLSALLVSGLSHAKPSYTDSRPLIDVVNTSVGSVRSGGKIQVPLITWGADVRTIYANGNSANTTADSIFNQLGLRLQLVREDTYTRQLSNYLSGKTPYLRGTLGMIAMSSELLNRDARTRPIIIYQLSESAGGDAMVVKEGIRTAKDLCDKTIALQAYGPHVDYLTKILTDACGTASKAKLRWLPDLTGTNNSPMEAFKQSSVDAAMVITPDALALTSGGTVGTGSEDSVAGARILLSTKTANRIIADVYAVRSDYFQKNRAEVEKFVRGLMLAQENVAQLFKDRNNRRAEYQSMLRASAKMLLDSAQAVSDTEAMYNDAHHMSVSQNVKFFTDKKYQRSLSRRSTEISKAFSSIGLLRSVGPLESADWNYGKLGTGLSTQQASTATFDERKLASAIARKQQQGTLKEGEIFSFEVFFKPNQKVFSADLYRNSFDKVIELASTYGGAVITVEGHSDPLGYLRKKKNGSNDIVLRRMRQATRNLSLTRANAVRDSIIQYAKSQSITLDTSQFAVVGHGIDSPKSGICGADPCAPKTEQQWRDNMRVQFRIIQLEAESDVFRPL